MAITPVGREKAHIGPTKTKGFAMLATRCNQPEMKLSPGLIRAVIAVALFWGFLFTVSEIPTDLPVPSVATSAGR
jgi:hypothetical protein